MEIDIAQAVAIIRKSPDVGDVGVYRLLVEAGFEQMLAARLVEFLPAAYCRVLLGQGGPRFSDTFQGRGSDGKQASNADHLCNCPISRRPLASKRPSTPRLAKPARTVLKY